MSLPIPRSDFSETTPDVAPLSPNSHRHHHEQQSLIISSVSGSGRPRRGSVQLMHDINVQQFSYPHSVTNTPISPSPLSLLSTLLNGSNTTTDGQLQQDIPSEDGDVGNTLSPEALIASMDAPAPSIVVDGTTLEDNDASIRRAARELLPMSNMRHTRSIVDPRGGGIFSTSGQDSLDGMELEEMYDNVDEDEQQMLLSEHGANGDSNSFYGSTGDLPVIPKMNHASSLRNDTAVAGASIGRGGQFPIQSSLQPSQKFSVSEKHTQHHVGWISVLVQQVSAVAVVALLNMMMAIPFGASYFPIGWRADGTDNGDSSEDDNVNGLFPLPGKQALGLRMFLFATMIAQLVFAFKSKFINAVGLQMVENVPFLHALAETVIARQGYGADALSTLFFLFGLSSVIVGTVFYLLGKLRLGKIVYFFPNHVLVGCIGGIGVFLVFTSIEVATNAPFSLDMKGVENVIENFPLLWVVLAFEATLRLLTWITEDKDGRPKFQLLSPIFYIMITPLFYLGLFTAGISIDDARKRGYFFPATDSAGSDASVIWDPHIWDVFRVIDFRSISWTAVLESTGTMIALAAFSLIHVPINIPAFAISTDVETDMNAELIAHGYSNALSGMFGGLQNYMTYSNSVLYAKTGGKGLISSLAIVFFTAGLFVVGPSMCDFLPRCMAGTLLLHIGIDLVLEGVYDSIGQYDHLEYAGIWLITIVMTVWGMTSALIAGIVSALSTYAVQSINYQNPIRQVMTATSLRSSAWTRCAGARAILENERTGRARVLIFQLNGHLFFGNVAQLTDTIKDVLRVKHLEGDLPIVVIIDFTLVVGMDSSAAHAIAKLKKIIHRLFHVEISIFVTGSDRGGFPCEFALSEALAGKRAATDTDKGQSAEEAGEATHDDKTDGSEHSKRYIAASKILSTQLDGRVSESLDEALRFAEDILIARQDPQHLFSSVSASCLPDDGLTDHAINLTMDEERYRAKRYLRNLLEYPDETSRSANNFLTRSIALLVSIMTREEYKQDDILWEQGAESTSLKIIVSGDLVSIIEETGASEAVARGNIVGELGLVQPGTRRLTTLVCASPIAVLYSLDRESWTRLKRDDPQVASLVDGLVIRYLAHRVQHVSNRYFHTTLPV